MKSVCNLLPRLLAALLLLTACGDERPPESNRSAPATGTVIDWTRASMQRPGNVDSLSLLMDAGLREGAQTDQAVFSFESAIPGYTAAYTADSVRECGSGRSVALEGSRAFTIQFEPAAAHRNGASTLSQRSHKPEMPLIREMTVICDFEGHLTWALGMRSEASYRVRTDSTRARVILEFRR